MSLDKVMVLKLSKQFYHKHQIRSCLDCNVPAQVEPEIPQIQNSEDLQLIKRVPYFPSKPTFLLKGSTFAAMEHRSQITEIMNHFI